MNWSRGGGFTLVAIMLMSSVDGISAQSLDEQLLEGLRSDPLDTELGQSLFGPGESGELEQGRGQEDKPGPRDLRERLRRDTAVPDEATESPALGVARSMREVQSRLSRANWDVTTQTMQAKILTDLDAMIEQAARRCGHCQGSSSGDSRNGQPGNTPGELEPGATNRTAAPTDEGTEKAEAGAEGRIGDVLKRVWGELPDVQRQRVLQAMGEEFLPEYRALIESYYRRLAEEMP